MKKHPLRAKCAVGSCLQLSIFEMKKSQPAKKKLALNITSLVNLQGVTGGDIGEGTSTLITTSASTIVTKLPSDCHCPPPPPRTARCL